MDGSREEILGSLRLAEQAPAPLPSFEGIGVRYPDPIAQFAKSLGLAQHVALVLAASAIAHNLHQAYERLQVGGPGFAMFISGPSKTADIEQALVIGAQGPRSCTVFVLG